jgi:hypothetical protein
MVMVVERGGLVLATGALMRPPDPREHKYLLTRTLAPRAVDLSRPRLLSRWQGRDVRVPDLNRYYQGRLGSCAAAATAMGAEMAARIAGRGAVPGCHFGWMYEWARRMRGWFGQDTGSYVADNCDLAIAGCPPLTAAPYVEDPAYDYPDVLDSQRTEDYVLAHQPFYPSQGGFIENVWAALDAGKPVVFASYWPAPWFSPTGGRIPEGVPFRPGDGGHAYVVWGIVPGWFLCETTWSTGFSPDAAAFGYDLRPGGFALPWSYAQTGHIWEARALSYEPVQPAPEPEPEPEPQPEPTDGYARAVAVARAARDALAQDAARYPRSTARKWKAQGAGAVVSALEQAGSHSSRSMGI